MWWGWGGGGVGTVHGSTVHTFLPRNNLFIYKVLIAIICRLFKVHCYLVPNRCVPKQKVSDVPSLGHRVPWTSCPLYDVSFGRRVPLDDVSLDDASLTDGP
jgi:hypothetical protein